MPELQLWRVRVERTQTASATAIVWAESRRQAMQMAESEVDLDDMLDSTDDTSSAAFRADVADLESIKPGSEWLVMPDGSGTDDIDEFRSVLTPEMQFVMQQRRWEQNGQMALEVTA